MPYKILNKIEQPQQIRGLSRPELTRLSHEIRDYIITTVAHNGGHLASNLGIVELTLALHLAFDSPRDKLIFDVSHQTYVHKLLTGRYQTFTTLRQYGGISGFAKKRESVHDIFEAGHASTSISAALGLAKARDLKRESHHVVAVIGDGALTGGMAYEGLINAGHSNSRLIIILNDNEMSISKNVSGMTKYLSRLRTDRHYYRAKEGAHHYIDRIPAVGKPIAQSISKVKDSIKQILVPGMLFEELGLTYLGVIDGHNIDQLKDMMTIAKQVDGPVLMHVATKKGKGLDFAERSPENYHGIGPFNVQTGSVLKNVKNKTFSNVFGEALMAAAARDKTICAITAAMPAGTGLTKFAESFSDRYFDVGIAEAHAVTFAAGLASGGMKPFFAVYSTFLQRGYDQMIHDVCIQNLDVTFCIDRAGLVGQDGETHHGAFDLSYLLAMPNMMVMAPKDGVELRQMIALAAISHGPIAIRYPRGVTPYDAEPDNSDLSAEALVYGSDFVLVAVGSIYHEARLALDQLLADGIKGTLVHPKILKPFDRSILKAFRQNRPLPPLFTVEDNVKIGGYGQFLAAELAKRGLAINVTTLGLPDRFVEHGDVKQLYRQVGLDAMAIVHNIKANIHDLST